MEKDSNEEADSDEEILNYGSKKLLTFLHNEVVMNFSSSEDDDVSSEDESEQSLDSSLFNDTSLVNDEKNSIRFNSVLSPSPPPPPLKHARLDVLKSSEVLQRLRKECVVASTPDDQIWEKKCEDLCQIKVRLHGEVKKFFIKKNEPFLKIIEQIAKQEKVPITCVVLNNKLTTIDVNDSVQKLNITICDIIECMIYENNEELDKITISIQAESNTKRKSKIDFKISPIEKLSDLFSTYCESNHVNIETTSFTFDGDKIDPNKTAIDIGIEDGDVIDVIFN
ncbi:NFATC2-interacting protein isoform X1 [Hydra vulgaris]|uniref:NFATC2-interacting protein isoform X1 n=1 Tax=Hydra vulgaris TaxID=6087 RepID=UPI001F5F4250|nr:NFATC2-interacting protein [Hydra vulgaris]